MDLSWGFSDMSHLHIARVVKCPLPGRGPLALVGNLSALSGSGLTAWLHRSTALGSCLLPDGSGSLKRPLCVNCEFCIWLLFGFWLGDIARGAAVSGFLSPPSGRPSPSIAIHWWSSSGSSHPGQQWGEGKSSQSEPQPGRATSSETATCTRPSERFVGQ